MPRWYGHAVDTLSTLMTTIGAFVGWRPVSGLTGRGAGLAGGATGEGSGDTSIGLGAGGAALGGGGDDELPQAAAPQAAARSAARSRERRGMPSTVGEVCVGT